MIQELIDHLNASKVYAGKRPLLGYEDLTENNPDRPSRGTMVLAYRRAIKYPCYLGEYSYSDYFRDLADRAIRLWRIGEGAHRLRVGKDTPMCAGESPLEEPIFGSLNSVVAILFAMKLQNQSYSYSIAGPTIRALETGPGFWKYLDEDLLGCVYYCGTLFVTSSPERYCQLRQFCQA
jgi:hypothetical protein